MKINKKVLLILLIIGLSNIQSASFGFGMMKKSANRNHFSNSSKNNSYAAKENTQTQKTQTKTQSKGIITSYFAVSTSITSSKSVTSKTSTSSTTTTRGGDIPDFSIYYEGWVKYLHFSDDTKKPKAFFKNTRYAPETRAKINMPDKDSVK